MRACLQVCQPGPPEQQVCEAHEAASSPRSECVSFPLQEWRLAVVRGCNEQGLYTVQYEPVEQNRHKQTGVEYHHGSAQTELTPATELAMERKVR